MATSAAVITKPNFSLADRIKIQQQAVREKQYIRIGKLMAIVFEAQRSTAGLSQSQARWHNSRQAALMKDQPGLHPFSEKQALLWASITLDWLNEKNAPDIAISRDQKDLLLPFGMTPLPAIPDPRWVPKRADSVCPRIAQRLTGCPVVGDRVTDAIKGRDGHLYGVIHPIVEMAITLAGAERAFCRIRGGVEPSEGTHLSLLIDDSNPLQMEGYFVGGRFRIGG